MVPTKRPGMVLSEMARRVMDLQDKGWSVTKIGQHSAADKNTILDILADPQFDPRYITGKLLVELHEAQMMGTNRWDEMVRTLVVKHKMSFAQIARCCGVSRQYLRYGFRKDKMMPRYRLGSNLEKLFEAKEREAAERIPEDRRELETSEG